MQTLKQIEQKRDEIKKISALQGVRRLRIFGSVARGTATLQSDVDFLIDLDSDRSLFDLGELQMDSQSLLECKVDIVTEKGLHWYLKERILKEA